MSGLLMLMLTLLVFTGCGADSEPTVSDGEEKEEVVKVEARYNPLFDEVYYPIANRDIKHDKDSIEKFLKGTEFTIEEDKETDNITITDEESAEEYSEDKIFLMFEKSKEGVSLLHISYISRSKDTEIVFDNYDYEDAPENDQLIIHQSSGENKGVEVVETIDSQIEFLNSN